MTIAIATVTDSISQIDIAGVQICDIDEIRTAVTDRDCPVLMPEPLNFMGNIVIVADAFGPASTRKRTITYTLNYTFLYCPVGQGRELERYGDMVEKAFAILDGLILEDDLTGSIAMNPVAVTEFGPVPDPAGNQFLGCRFQLQVQEFIN